MIWQSVLNAAIFGGIVGAAVTLLLVVVVRRKCPHCQRRYRLGTLKTRTICPHCGGSLVKQLAPLSVTGIEAMSLVFDDRQLLAPGIHDATLEEIDRLLARFQKTDRRIRLFERLRVFVGEVEKAFTGAQVIIDGSFVMPCVDEPGDIDFILVLPPDIDLAGDFRPFEYNVISPHRVRTEYKFDMHTVNMGSAGEREQIEFFSQVSLKWCRLFGWPAETKKGLVRVIP